MTTDRAYEIRIVAAPAPPNTVAAVRVVVAATLGPGWRVERLVARGSLVLIRGRSEEPVATTGHARQSHDAAVALAETGRFETIEADVPVRGFATNEGAVASAQPLYWVHQTLRWEEALVAMAPESRGGRGIRIGHPDTGYTDHPNLGLTALDLTTDRDVIDNDDDARDDLDQNPLWPLPFPGHGTSTASVIVGHGPVDSGIVGLAGEGRLVPIRATESVVQVFDSDVARAVAHARRVGCHVISMSLGGKGFFGLEEEIQRVVDGGLIVMAAAGNFVRFVTAPASYPNCLAVAATGPGDRRWEGSSRGPAVDVSMPGEQVYVARFTEAKQPYVGASNGTSFAVAHLAGAVALWLAHHGRDALLQRYGAPRIQAAFIAVLGAPGVCVVPSDWSTDWGVGRVDLPALLQAQLPDRHQVDTRTVAANDAATRIGYAVGADPAVVGSRLADLLPVDGATRLDELLHRHEGELVYLAYTDPVFASAVSSARSIDPRDIVIDTRGIGARLAALLRSRR